MSQEPDTKKNYYDSTLKRRIDVLVATLGVPFALVAVALVGIAIKLDDGGSIFYRQKRVGKNGEMFTVLKLRTYNDQGEKTRVGLAIRPFAIDELPQVFNIFRGDMSAFGIRALSQINFDRVIELYESDPDQYEEGFLEKWKQSYYSARPGGLSLAAAKADSVFSREYETPPAMKKKMQHDIEQIDCQSPGMDMEILVCIARRVLSRNRAN